jgi:hypothetical protein
MLAITNRKFIYISGELILHRNITGKKENEMSATSITQAQDKGLRHHFSSLRRFAAGLYAAHGGWPRQGGVAQVDMSGLVSLAARVENHSPSLSAELRNLASRG